jgi:hypothetical protein
MGITAGYRSSKLYLIGRSVEKGEHGRREALASYGAGNSGTLNIELRTLNTEL